MTKNPKKLKLSDLKIKKTPNPPRQAGDAKLGKKHKMPYTHFVHSLFAMNAQLKKMTDAEIVRQIRLEYPTRDFKDRFKDEMSQRKEMARLRSFYNAGTLVPSFGPPEAHLTAFYYDIDGHACNPRYSTPRRLSLTKIKEIQFKTGERRKRWLKKIGEEKQ